MATDRRSLIDQMAWAFAGERPSAAGQPEDDLRRRAAEALAKVEVYLGVEIEQAKDYLTKVLEEVS